MPSAPRHALLATLVSLSSLLACDVGRTYERRPTSDWVVGQTKTVGGCAFTLDHAWLKHADDWRGGVTMTIRNGGGESTRCGWDAVIVGANQKAVSGHGGKAVELAPGGERVSRSALKASYMANAAVGGAWLWVGVYEGAAMGGGTVEHNVANPEDAPSTGM